MKRKQQRKSAKSGQQLPSDKMGDESCFPNQKYAPNSQSCDFQNIDYQLIQLLKDFVDKRIQAHSAISSDSNRSQDIINPPNTIVKPIKEGQGSTKYQPQGQHEKTFLTSLLNETHEL